MSHETVDNVQVLNPQKSIRQASRELQLPKSTIYKVLHKSPHLHDFKVQITQALQPNYRPVRFEFATSMLNAIDGDNEYLHIGLLPEFWLLWKVPASLRHDLFHVVLSVCCVLYCV